MLPHWLGEKLGLQIYCNLKLFINKCCLLCELKHKIAEDLVSTNFVDKLANILAVDLDIEK